MECGLGVPRPPLRLELGHDGRVSVKTCDGAKDFTQEMLEWAECKLEILRERDVAAFILKAKSPSCALRSACVFRDGKEVKTDAQGLFTMFLKARFKTMPVFEETESAEKIKEALLLPR
jgi:uncharacterized protein YbbK (DUF523 family)